MVSDPHLRQMGKRHTAKFVYPNRQTSWATQMCVNDTQGPKTPPYAGWTQNLTPKAHGSGRFMVLCVYICQPSHYINGHAKGTPENRGVPMPKHSAADGDSITPWETQILRRAQYREEESSGSRATLGHEEDRTASSRPSSGTKKHASLPC